MVSHFERSYEGCASWMVLRDGWGPLEEKDKEGLLQRLMNTR
jgi:hypothetical protein